jgi:hypothetical protein
LGAILTALLAMQSVEPQPRNDTRTWYQAYADAQRNIQQQNWDAAIADIEAASRRGAPKPGRNILFYGDVYRDFNPDYYLGVAYLNLARYEDADRAFARVAQAQLIAPRDSLFADLSRQIATVKDVLGKQAASQSAVPNVTQSAVPAAPPLPPDTPSSVTADAGGRASEPDLVPSGAADPSQYAASAPYPGASSPQTPIQQPPPRNPAPQATPNRAAPANAIVTTPGRIAPVPLPPADERSALVDFFSGRYEAAASKLVALTGVPNASPRAYFYLACSRAALALTGKADATTAIAEARAQLARAGDIGQFAADRPLISPRIQQTLGIRP